MMNGRSSLAGPVLLVTALGACGGDEPEPCIQLEGACVGVPQEPVCDDDFCTDGVSCANVCEVHDEAELADALATAGQGTCIALAPGAYPAIALPSGVSLLGKSARDVTTGSLQIPSGSPVVVRGLEVSGSVELAPAATARVEAVRIGGGNTGVVAPLGASLDLVSSEVRGVQFDSQSVNPSNGHALFVSDATAVSVDGSVVADNAGPGMWSECSGGCACPSRPTVSLHRVLFQHNHHVSVALNATAATIDVVHILDSEVGPSFDYGAGLSVSACSALTVSGLRVERTVSFGMLVNGSSLSAAPGGAGEHGIIVVDGGLVGLWVENVPTGETVELLGVELQRNGAVGLGIGADLAAKGIIVVDGGLVADTVGAAVPVSVDGIPMGSDTVGDGVLWTGAALADVDGIAVGNSPRNAFLIDGPVEPGSKLAHVTLQGGDAQKEIVQQRSDATGSPELGEGVPSLDQSIEDRFSVALGPQPPPAIGQ
jgi:hypothetical protein